MHHRLASPLFVLPLLALASVAQAEPLTQAPLPPQPIWGGAQVQACGWPTTVFMDGCTGTLVHPELVVFAAHCMFFAGGEGPAVATFGESADAPAREVPTSSCTMFPGWFPDEGSFGNDVAFCQLAQPVTDVPIVPILMGCETEVLQPGQEITLVGYGVTNGGGVGVKNEVVTTVNGFEGPEISVGGNGTSSCNGDSGGPAYVQLEDGSWRVFGITSRGVTGDCADESIYGLIHSHVQWIEDETGLDITPCHDADGTWNPSEGCTEFPLTPGVGESGWPEGCSSLRLSAPSATCGDPFFEDPGTTGEPDTGGVDESTSGDTTDGTDTGLPGGTAEGDSTTGPFLDPTTTTASADSTGTGDTAPVEDDGGDPSSCACRADAPARGALPWLLLLFGLPLRRRAVRR